MQVTYIDYGSQYEGRWSPGMPRLMRDLPGAQPVDKRGASIGPPVTLPAGADFTITIRKLNSPSDSFEDVWCEILMADQLYRVPLRRLEFVNAA